MKKLFWFLAFRFMTSAQGAMVQHHDHSSTKLGLVVQCIKSTFSERINNPHNTEQDFHKIISDTNRLKRYRSIIDSEEQFSHELKESVLVRLCRLSLTDPAYRTVLAHCCKHIIGQAAQVKTLEILWSGIFNRLLLSHETMKTLATSTEEKATKIDPAWKANNSELFVCLCIAQHCFYEAEILGKTVLRLSQQFSLPLFGTFRQADWIREIMYESVRKAIVQARSKQELTNLKQYLAEMPILDGSTTKFATAIEEKLKAPKDKEDEYALFM